MPITPGGDQSDYMIAKRISKLSVSLLRRSLVLPMTVSRIAGSEFAGDNGDTVTVRVRQPGAARTQDTPGDTIVYDELTEVPVDVSLTHIYHATKITDEDLSLSLVDFGSQVTEIQVDAVATRAEDELADVFNALPADIPLLGDGSDVEAGVLEARKRLTRANVPGTERWLAASPEVVGFLLATENLSFADRAADDSALRDAVIGRYRGFNVVESNALDEGTAVAYHTTGWAFTNRSPVSPRGAVASSEASDSGISMRQIFQYDPDVLSDASVLSTFAGAALIDADRVVKLAVEDES
jgi:hypothetical protein